MNEKVLTSPYSIIVSSPEELEYIESTGKIDLSMIQKPYKRLVTATHFIVQDEKLIGFMPLWSVRTFDFMASSYVFTFAEWKTAIGENKNE